LSAIRVPSRLPTTGASRHGTPMHHAMGANPQPKIISRLSGTGEGLHLALNVGAMLISFLALIALLNALLGLVHLSLPQIFGWVFAPVAWSMGVPWRDAPTIGNLLGTRMALNEFVAYSQLGPLKASLDPKSFTIATYALCGFANFSSIGIQIGGIGALAPNRRHDLARLGLRAMFAGTLANFMTATIAGFLL
jgi:CNT family concentrative nucleoside transporter